MPRVMLPDQRNMKGVVNAWLLVNGDGDSAANLKGSGQMLISPAALYEVPVVLEMLNALSSLQFAVPNRAAFNYALMSFRIHDEAFEFEPIDLSGDSLALRGRGRVGFGGDVYAGFLFPPTHHQQSAQESCCVQHDVACHGSGPRHNLESSDNPRQSQNR